MQGLTLPRHVPLHNVRWSTRCQALRATVHAVTTPSWACTHPRLKRHVADMMRGADCASPAPGRSLLTMAAADRSGQGEARLRAHPAGSGHPEPGSAPDPLARCLHTCLIAHQGVTNTPAQASQNLCAQLLSHAELTGCQAPAHMLKCTSGLTAPSCLAAAHPPASAAAAAAFA